MSGAYHASVNVICFESCVLYRSSVILCCVRGSLPWHFMGGWFAKWIVRFLIDWQRAKRTVAYCRRGLGREGIGTRMMMQY